jgi:hypothetical protein
MLVSLGIQIVPFIRSPQQAGKGIEYHMPENPPDTHAVQNICGEPTSDGSPCQRRVKPGSGPCSDHAGTFWQTIKAWARNSTLSFLIAATALLLGFVMFGGWIYDDFIKRPPTVMSVTMTGEPIEVVSDNFTKTFSIHVGGYQDFVKRFGTHSYTVRFDLKQIVEAKIPTESFPKDIDQAIIYTNTGGGLVYGGAETTARTTNEFSVPEVIDNINQEPRSVYWFHARDDSFEFCRLIVDHIDRNSGTVTMSVFFLRKNW